MYTPVAFVTEGDEVMLCILARTAEKPLMVNLKIRHRST
jgi:hypothetical protein